MWFKTVFSGHLEGPLKYLPNPCNGALMALYWLCDMYGSCGPVDDSGAPGGLSLLAFPWVLANPLGAGLPKQPL